MTKKLVAWAERDLLRRLLAVQAAFEAPVDVTVRVRMDGSVVLLGAELFESDLDDDPPSPPLFSAHRSVAGKRKDDSVGALKGYTG